MGPKLPTVQRPQFFLPESVRDSERVNARWLELLLAGPLTAPHGGGVLVTTTAGTARTAPRSRTWAAVAGPVRQDRCGRSRYKIADNRQRHRDGDHGVSR